VPGGNISAVQPERRRVVAERISQRYSATLPSSCVTSNVSQECGLTKSISVTTPVSSMSSFIANVPKP
jgi:hypothetical protein